MITNVEMLSILNKWFWTAIDLSINIHKIRFSPNGSKHRVPDGVKSQYVHKHRKIKEFRFKKKKVEKQLNKKKNNTSCSKIMKITHELKCPHCKEPLTISLEVKKKNHNLNEDKVMTV